MIRLAVRVRREQAELALAELLELAPAGVEEVELAGGMVEYAVYGAPGELPALPELRAAAGGALVEISTSELPDDWSERWKRFHRPVLVERPGVPALHVRPPWEPPSGREDVAELVIDPGQAFGTGAHATTHLCLELLLEVAARGPLGPVVDLGAGSGVLAIAAARLGGGPVLALDNDPEAVAAAARNAEVNGVAIEAHRLDLRGDPVPRPAGAGEGLLLANLLRPLLLELAGRLEWTPAHLIASGLLAHEADEVAGRLCERLSLLERERRHSGEWAALWLVPAAPQSA